MNLTEEKTDVLQGTLALMVLETLDVFAPLHGYGFARRSWKQTEAVIARSFAAKAQDFE